MPKTNSIISESLAASSNIETDETLFIQLDELERRNNLHKRNSQVRDRVKEAEVCIQRCRQLIGNNDASAALLYVKCLSFIAETDRILSGGRNSVMSNTASSHISSTLNRIRPIEMQNFNVSNARSQNLWGNSVVQVLPGEIGNSINEEEDERYNYYGYNKNKWWRVLCMNSAKEAKTKEADSDVRDLWNTQLEFFLSCLGFIVGVGNIMRFPVMIYTYGGIFLVPYIICLCIFGLPLVYMHLCIGQYSGLSASGAFWKLMPVASGIGWALVLLAVPVAIYYNVIVAWGLYYSWFSIQGIFLDNGLPWSHCTEVYRFLEWITNYHCCELTPESLYTQNFTACYAHNQSMTAPEAFFHYQVLNRTPFKDAEFGGLQIQMIISLAIAWILVFFGVFKGIGSIGWAVTVTSTLPYLMLIVLLLKGLSLDRDNLGLKYFFTLDFGYLWTTELWRHAAQQVFYELGIDAGPLISMASFSRYRNNIYRDAVLLVLINFITSFLCGLVIFSFIGFLATYQGNGIEGVLKHEPLYMAFTVYPGAISFMDLKFLWATLFFGMLTLSALDAEFAWLEMIASAIMNQLGSKHKSLETRLLIGLCIFCFICGIPLCARGGIFIFHSIENLNANWNSFSLSLLIIITVCYVYGVDRFLDNIGEMLDVKKPPSQGELPGKSRWYILTKRVKYFFGPTGNYIRFSWCLFAPFILTICFINSIVDTRLVTFNESTLPPSYDVVAGIAMVGPLFVIPFTVAYTLYEAWKRKKSLWSVFDGENWENKKVKEEEHEIIIKEDDYMYIDPMSRGASAKSRTTDPNIGHQPTNEDNYTQAADRIRELAARSSRNEPLRSISDSSVVTTADYQTNNYEMDEIKDDGELYGRKSGRIRDLVLNENCEDREETSNSSSSSEIYATESERRSTVKRSPFNKSTAVYASEEPTLTLFGPPPVQHPPNVLSQSQINKKRDQRRSDQRKNRAFNNSFNLVVTEQSQDSSASNSNDQMPSPAVPDRPSINDQRSRLSSRISTESDTNISLSPFIIPSSTSTESTSEDPFPLTLAVPTLKRPKPIGNIPKKK